MEPMIAFEDPNTVISGGCAPGRSPRCPPGVSATRGARLRRLMRVERLATLRTASRMRRLGRLVEHQRLLPPGEKDLLPLWKARGGNGLQPEVDRDAPSRGELSLATVNEDQVGLFELLVDDAGVTPRHRLPGWIRNRRCPSPVQPADREGAVERSGALPSVEPTRDATVSVPSRWDMSNPSIERAGRPLQALQQPSMATPLGGFLARVGFRHLQLGAPAALRDMHALSGCGRATYHRERFSTSTSLRHSMESGLRSA